MRKFLFRLYWSPLLTIRGYKWPITWIVITTIVMVGGFNFNHPLDSQVFLGIMIFFGCLTVGMIFTGTCGMLFAKTPATKDKFRRMMIVGCVMTFVICYCIIQEIQNPTNPFAVHLADEFIK